MVYKAFVGTYTSDGSRGIYQLTVTEGKNPTVERTGSTSAPDNLSFLAPHPDLPILYAVHTVGDGEASAFRIERDSNGNRQLTPLGRVTSGACGPCHCSVHPSGEFLLVAHYTGGSVSILPIDGDGTLREPTDVVEHEGFSRNPNRQREAHPHSITPGPDNRFVYVPDLGTDEVVVYELDDRTGQLKQTTAVDARPGEGPRHMDFHPNDRYAYVLNELGSTLVAYDWDPEDGSLTEIGVASMLPDTFDGENQSADVHVHPSGNWVYASNRGHDSIAVFDIGDKGAVTFRGAVPGGGEWPRNFAISPGGTALFVENRHSGSIVPFRLDIKTGDLEQTGDGLSVPEPVCLQFVD